MSFLIGAPKPIPKKKIAKSHMPFKNSGESVQGAPDDAMPASIAPFKQSEFMGRIHAECFTEDILEHGDLIQSLYQGFYSSEAGICTALCLEWYDALKRGKNFIDMMQEQKKVDAFYADELLKVHMKLKTIFFKSPNLPGAFKNHTDAAESDITSRAVLQQIQHDYGFTQSAEVEWTNTAHSAVAVPSQKPKDISHLTGHDHLEALIKQLYETSPELADSNVLFNLNEKYFNELSKTGQHNVGLHIVIIAVQDEKQTKSHAVAWTKVENGFAIFDPNVGEMFFKDYLIMSRYFNTLISKYGTSHNTAIVTRDFYSSEDISNVVTVKSNMR